MRKPKKNYAKFGESVWTWIISQYPDCASEEIETMMEWAGQSGLCVRIEYDPKIHGEIDADVGDRIWYWGKSK